MIKITNKKVIWITALLAIFFPPLAFLYIERLMLALVSFIVLLILWYLGISYNDFFSKSTLQDINIFVLIGKFLFVALAIYLSRKYNRSELPKWYAQWKGVVGILLVSIIIQIIIDTFFYGFYKIPSDSMLPNYKKGDVILVEKWPYGHYRYKNILFFKGFNERKRLPNRGEVIVYFSESKKNYNIKRVVALEGDHIYINDLSILLNDKPMVLIPGDDGAYLTRSEKPYWVQYGPSGPHYSVVNAHISKGYCYLLGDNRNNSYDSRIHGEVKIDSIVGRVIASF